MNQKIKQLFFNLKKDGNKLLILADQIVVSGGNFLLGLVLIRVLGLETYGLFALLWMGVLFALSMHQAYITKPLMTLAVTKNPEDQQQYFQTLWQVQLVGISLALFGLFLFIQVASYFNLAANWLQYVPITGLITSCYLLQDFIKKTFFIKKVYDKPLLMDSLCYSLLFIGLFLAEKFSMSSLYTTLFLLLSGYAISSLLFCASLFKNITLSVSSWKPLLKKHYHFSSWLLGTSILQWFSGNFFLVAAASTLGTIAVGAVRMGQNIVGLCHLLFLAMENIVPTEAAQHFFKNGSQALINYLQSTTYRMGILVLAVLGVMAFAAPLLLQLFYGANYTEYRYVVWGYCLLYVFVFLGFPARYFFRTLQNTKPIFLAYCLSAAFSLSAAFPMVQHWGIIGLLVGLISSQILTLLLYFYHINTWKSMELV